MAQQHSDERLCMAVIGGLGLVDTVIAPTAAAPNPQITAVILLTKSLPKIARFIASESVAGIAVNFLAGPLGLG